MRRDLWVDAGQAAARASAPDLLLDHAALSAGVAPAESPGTPAAPRIRPGFRDRLRKVFCTHLACPAPEGYRPTVPTELVTSFVVPWFLVNFLPRIVVLALTMTRPGSGRHDVQLAGGAWPRRGCGIQDEPTGGKERPGRRSRQPHPGP